MIYDLTMYNLQFIFKFSYLIIFFSLESTAKL